MKIKSYAGEYSVEFCKDLDFFEKIRSRSNTFFVIDKKVFHLYQESLEKIISSSPYCLMDATEEHKTAEEALHIISQMIDMPSKRNTILVAIGGGIVQDVSAFISNILYRGISWIFIPTTLLSQTDSCIGSKSSLNFAHYKNILGYFYPPREIYVNTGFVRTLDDRDYRSGLGEIFKCALMAGDESFQATCSHLEEMLTGNEKILIEEIEKALTFKKGMIEDDEFDRGRRNLMNFGHTFGHALEATSNYRIPHGQAVTYGMMIANEISFGRGYIGREMADEICRSLWRITTPGLLKEEYFAEDAYLGTMKKDKKYTGGAHTCILFHGNGVEKHSDVNDREVMEAIGRLFGETWHADSL